jgi:hypothetical protein
VVWRWGNEGKLYVALDEVTDDAIRDGLLDALDDMLDDPYGPWSHPMQGNRYRTDRFIDALPHGWFLVFTPYEHGVPLMKTPVLVVPVIVRT